MVSVLKENIPAEVEAFRTYWPGDLFLDEAQGFYRAVGGGEPYRHSLIMFLLKLICPFPSRLKANARRTKESGVEGNMDQGEGLITGGLYVMRAGGGMEYAFREDELGDHAPLEEVLAACKRAAGGR
jgi:hypothetical protein|mmetsp:Transcript_41886/g.70758  ORF Transcript_41886/g.70758 Transcript_41886/m.70758 type:complete len:127 (-) Transcript_41886:99-479(-)